MFDTPPRDAVRAVRIDVPPDSAALQIVDFFCGIGGTSFGARSSGARVLLGIDLDGTVEETFRAANAVTDEDRPRFIAQDVQKVSFVRLRRLIADRGPGALVFVGCPPCQPFTKLNTDKTHQGDKRDALSRFLQFVEHFYPQYVVIENVPGITDSKYGPVWSGAVQRLDRRGYRLRFERIDAKKFGVPQSRLRTVLVAARGSGPVPWPEYTHGSAAYRTVQQAIGDLPNLEAGERDPKDSLHIASSLSDRNLARIRALTSPGASRAEWPEDLQLDCYRDHTGHTDVYGRMRWDAPAPTLTTRFVSLSNGRFGHPDQDRAITPREGARLMGFPDKYPFDISKRDRLVRHIGNAVPPPLSEAIFRAIAQDVMRLNDVPAGSRWTCRRKMRAGAPT